ncbi:hypothetical protein NBRC116187_13310 [Halopseudomonas sabulinigri]|uniref:Uncharacterized protein n=1 Tax=Halopseudomonas sabulinigri TaxID=472181 RepID=A0ABP9ZNC4_9GAMM
MKLIVESSEDASLATAAAGKRAIKMGTTDNVTQSITNTDDLRTILALNKFDSIKKPRKIAGAFSVNHTAFSSDVHSLTDGKRRAGIWFPVHHTPNLRSDLRHFQFVE